MLDEIRPNDASGTSFVVYTKFEGCEHASDKERGARIIVTDEDGEVLMESAEYSVYLDGTEEPVTIVAAFDLPEGFEVEEETIGSRPSSTRRPLQTVVQDRPLQCIRDQQRPGFPGLSSVRKPIHA